MTQAPNPNEYAGRTLPGGYVADRVIGKGTFAWVFEGYAPDGERVAIKILRLRTHQGERRFVREIKVLRELPPNPHCVGYRGDGQTEDGAPYYAMEFIDGYTLRSVLKQGNALPEETACELMKQLCEGFIGLHKLGLAHRDIKPDNIMITRQGHQVKLMDFGLVQDSQGILKLFEERDIISGSDFAENLDQGMLVGTPEYMAPEQMADSQLGGEEAGETDVTADVYSLGVIFYQLLSGKKPFPLNLKAKKGAGFKREIYNYMRRRMKQDDNLIPRIDVIGDELWSIVFKALRRDPKLRQGSAMMLQADIQRYLATGEGIPDDLDVSETVAVSVDSIAGLHKILKNVEALYGEEGDMEALERHGKATIPPPETGPHKAQEAPTVVFAPTTAPDGSPLAGSESAAVDANALPPAAAVNHEARTAPAMGHVLPSGDRASAYESALQSQILAAKARKSNAIIWIIAGVTMVGATLAILFATGVF